MAATINLRHLEEGPQHLKGEISPKELGLEDLGDEIVRVTEPLHYDVEVSEAENGLLVSGKVSINLDCECVRCLKSIKFPVQLDPYHAFVPLEGEDAAPVANDSVDLGPIFREEVLLDFPQHPLCSEDCAGLVANPNPSSPGSTDNGKSGPGSSSAWGALDKLKL